MSLRARVVLLCAAFLVIAASASALGAVLVLRANNARRDHNELKAAAVAAEDLESTYIAQAALIRSSCSADWIRSGALIFGTSAVGAPLP